MRRITVCVREMRDANFRRAQRLASGTLFRVVLDGAPAREQLELPLVYSPSTRELLIHIHTAIHRRWPSTQSV